MFVVSLLVSSALVLREGRGVEGEMTGSEGSTDWSRSRFFRRFFRLGCWSSDAEVGGGERVLWKTESSEEWCWDSGRDWWRDVSTYRCLEVVGVEGLEREVVGEG